MISNIPTLALALAALASLPAAAHVGGETKPAMERGSLETGIPIIDSLGDYHMPVSTSSSLAQRYFDQGMLLGFGFHFAAAVRSFRASARIDPACAMCRWGLAWALGPSINHEATRDEAVAARAAIGEALRLAANATPRERALIAAMAKRYPHGAAVDDRAYEREMRDAARRFPRDAHVLTLLADALMTPRGRDYWTRRGDSRPWTREILRILERAIEAWPDHPGAHHLYIHVLEDSPYPARALASARKLPSLAPGVGHLVHMPAHVHFRLGHYAEAALANERAIEADRALVAVLPPDRRYFAGYMRHNEHFLWAASMMAGRRADAYAAAGRLAAQARASELEPGDGTSRYFTALPLLTQVRFGQWEDILRAPEPDARSAYLRGVWHFARTLAQVRMGNADAAAGELEALSRARSLTTMQAAELKNTNGLAALLGVAEKLALAEVAAMRGQTRDATAAARSAVALEDALVADEPPAWMLPARHWLGALLLESGRLAEAERVYRRDLGVFAENGWSLAGLAVTLERRGREKQAAAVRSRLETAWPGADMPLGASRF